MITTMFPVQKAGFEFWLRCLAMLTFKLPASPTPAKKRRFEDGGPCRGVRIQSKD